MIDENLVMTNLAYRELYMKYLGTLRVLGTLASQCKTYEVGYERQEEVEAVMDDASNFLRGRVELVPSKPMGFFLNIMEPNGR
ncbi:MAG: hypothetical protein WC869_00015 [Phycisphaerae bacterium]|jgi:hypothetical protein